MITAWVFVAVVVNSTGLVSEGFDFPALEVCQEARRATVRIFLESEGVKAMYVGPCTKVELLQKS